MKQLRQRIIEAMHLRFLAPTWTNRPAVIRRFLIHTLPQGFRRIRHAGFPVNQFRKEKLALRLQVVATPGSELPVHDLPPEPPPPNAFGYSPRGPLTFIVQSPDAPSPPDGAKGKKPTSLPGNAPISPQIHRPVRTDKTRAKSTLPPSSPHKKESVAILKPATSPKNSALSPLLPFEPHSRRCKYNRCECELPCRAVRSSGQVSAACWRSCCW